MKEVLLWLPFHGHESWDLHIVKLQLKSHHWLIERARVKGRSSDTKVHILTTGLHSQEAEPVFTPSLSGPVYVISIYLCVCISDHHIVHLKDILLFLKNQKIRIPSGWHYWALRLLWGSRRWCKKSEMWMRSKTWMKSQGRKEFESRVGEELLHLMQRGKCNEDLIR